MPRYRFRRDEPTSVPASGLTGTVDIPDAPAEERPRGLRSRARRVRESVAATVRGIPRAMRLAWAASPALTVAIGVITVVSGLLPAATAYLAKVLMDAVVAAIAIHAQHLPDLVQFHVPLLGIDIPFSSTTNIVALAVVQFLIFVLTTLTGALTTLSQRLLQEQVTLDIRHRIMGHASRLDLAFFEDSESYDLLRQAEQEAPTRPVAMINGAFGLLKTAITFASMIALLTAISPLLALVAIVTPIPAFIAQSHYGSRGFSFTLWASPIRRRMDYLSTLTTTDTYAKEVKLFGLGQYFTQRFHQLGRVYYDRQRRLISARTMVGAGWTLLSTLSSSLIYLYIALEAVNGRLTLGDLMLYTAAAASVQSSVQGLFSGFTGMYENNLYLDNLYRLLNTAPAITRPAQPRPLPNPLRGHVVFEHVSFSYPGTGEQAIQDLSFEIRPGQTVALVGRNGAGKSTLIKLLCRLYDPTEGRILIDGVDIREFDPDQIRSHIGAMFQDYVTYQATAGENIGLGDLDHLEDPGKISEAAQRAGADGVIDRLPNGYDTPLGRWFNRGANLSGGEWQKVALGRAFLREVPILVLDEPTSALDAQAEHDLFTRLRRLAHGRTALYISHRFSTVRQADRILLMEHGRLVEEGTHRELMDLAGGYATLFTLQASAYLDSPVTDPLVDPLSDPQPQSRQS